MSEEPEANGPGRLAGAIPTKESALESGGLQTEVRLLKQQLADLEKSSGRSFELLKWGMAMFTTFAIVVAGANWWTTKTNYEKDREFLKDQSALSEQRLALSQKELAIQSDKQVADIRTHLETNLAALAESNNRQLADIRAETKSNAIAIVTPFASQLLLSVTNMSLAVSNVQFLSQAELAANRGQMRTVLTNVTEASNLIVSNLLTELNTAMAKAEGLTLSVQGNQLCVGNNARNAEKSANMASGIASFAQAGIDFIRADEEISLKRCLQRLDKYFPVFIRNSPATSFPLIEDGFGLGNHLDELLTALRNSKQAERFQEYTFTIDINLKSYKKLVQEQRERLFSPRKRS